jgi:rubrerythrin
MGKIHAERAMMLLDGGGVTVAERSGSNADTLVAPASTGLAAGAAAVGEFRCRSCGYGVTVQRALPICPMCGGTEWEQASRPFGRARA